MSLYTTHPIRQLSPAHLFDPLPLLLNPATVLPAGAMRVKGICAASGRGTVRIRILLRVVRSTARTSLPLGSSTSELERP